MYVCFCLAQSIDDLVKDEECPAYLLKSKPCKCSFYIHALPTKGGEWGDIGFGADPFGVHVRVPIALFLCVNCLTGRWISTIDTLLGGRYIVGRAERVDLILVILTLFSRSHQPFEMSNFGFCTLSLKQNNGFLPNLIYCYIVIQ